MANSANASACQKSLFAKLVGGGVNYPQFAMVTLLRLAACSVPLLIGLTSRCFAHRARASCAPRHCHILNSQWSRRCAHRLACGPPLLIGLTTACFAHRARPSCAPLPVSAKILRIFERGNCKEAIFALENGIFRRSALHAHASPQFSMVVPLRSQARLRHSLLHWAYFGLFRALRAAFVRPRRTRRRGRF